MALNWTMLDDAKRPVPLGEEHFVMTIDKGAEVTISIPEMAGASSRKLKESGRMWLTEQRVYIPLFLSLMVQFCDPHACCSLSSSALQGQEMI